MQDTPIDPPAKSTRILALDYLRGMFIAIIIIDHVWRWPNLFQYISGRGELWTSAAEGFVIISGLLVGYVHGYKKRHLPLRKIAPKIVRRGFMLYVWSVICTLALVIAVWLFTAPGTTTLSTPLERGNWPQLLMETVSLSYVSTWTHFLYIYAFCLIVAPLVIWLLRKRYALIVLALSFIGWWFGVAYSIEGFQWQFVLFSATVGGYYFDTLLQYYRRLSRPVRQFVRWAPIILFGVTFVYSLSRVLNTIPGYPDYSFFSQDPLSLSTIILSFLWFAGLLSATQAFIYIVPGWLRNLFLTLGERSLTAYILHIIPLIGCQLLFPLSNNIAINTLITALAIFLTWSLMKIPHINRVIPR